MEFVMRIGGWAGAAVGLISAAMLLSACGGGSGSPSGGSTTSGNAQATATAGGTQPSSGAQPSSGSLSAPPKGALFFSVQKTALNGKPGGYVLVDGVGQVVYTYSGDTKGQPGSCTGSCAAQWPPVIGVPENSPADNTLPGTFGTTSSGQITWNGLPLYTYKGQSPHSSHAGGQWKDIPISCTYIVGGCPS